VDSALEVKMKRTTPSSQRVQGERPFGVVVVRLAIVAVTILLVTALQAGAEDKQALIRDALRAAPPEVTKGAKIVDWDGTVLRPGSGPYTCYPTPPQMRGKGKGTVCAAMCLDKTWLAWADAWANKKPFKADQVGIGYMLGGDTGASNIDPYAAGPTRDNQWVVSGPHTMVIVPDAAQLQGLSTDPNSGGAFVMWKDTPYVHIMVPVGKRAKR